MDNLKSLQTTKKGFQKLVEELKFREQELRREIGNTLQEMREMGDISENDVYTMAVEEQNINEERILELKDKIKNAVVIKDTGTNTVGIGNTVTLQNGKEIKYEITSEEESNPLEGKISISSPLGEAVTGKEVGAEVTISTPKGDTTYKIRAIA